MHEAFAYLPELIGALAVVVVLLFVIRQERARRDLRAMLGSEHKELTVLKNDFDALLSCSQNLAYKIKEQGKMQQSIMQQIRSMETQDDGNLATAHAAKLMDQGIGLDEISRICELTRGEVELLSRLAKYRKVA